jgi:hypothetical protein
MSESEDTLNLMQELTALRAKLVASVQDIDEQIAQLALLKKRRSLALTDEIEHKESLLKQHILTRASSLKIPGLTAVYQVKTLWDTEGLLSMAEEIPAIRQWHRAIAHVALRYQR